jgi:two-component system chemotaxis response regulator CheB
MTAGEASITAHRVIAMVASAGGLDALTRVLMPLPPDLRASVLVLQHASPDHVSHLAELLSIRVRLPVRTAVEGDVLAPATILVAPAGRHLLVTPQESLALIASGAFPPSRPSADLLLTSLALAVGARAIAVVLTGAGHDAATGATAVHHFGGCVIASDETSSLDFAMPSAAIGRNDVVDVVLPLEDIAAKLCELTESAPQSPASR